MLPTVLARQLQIGMTDYLASTYPATNAPFRGTLPRLALTKDLVFQEPFVSVRLPFRDAGEVYNPERFSFQLPFPPYAHQQRAFERLMAQPPRSTVVATGTGSGKTECFLYPILDYCRRESLKRADPAQNTGIKAVILYPMNSLANDQARRIAEFIHKHIRSTLPITHVGHESDQQLGAVRVGMYVGSDLDRTAPKPEKSDFVDFMKEHECIVDRETLRKCPPDILLTNYKMLDFLLMRPEDSTLWAHNLPETLRFLVVDELHTFDGAQGTDLACLIRRLKARLHTPEHYLCCVGTSATLGDSSQGAAILEYARDIFGETFAWDDALIVEDRLTHEEFLQGAETEIQELPKIPTREQVEALQALESGEDVDAYLTLAADAWLGDFSTDLSQPGARVELGERLRRHALFRDAIERFKGKYKRLSELTAKLVRKYPQFAALDSHENHELACAALRALLALLSHARVPARGADLTQPDPKLRPFLTVAVQLWTRELRRFLGKIDDQHINFTLAYDLNQDQVTEYLPVVSCRDCGATGWTAKVTDQNRRSKADALESFYDSFFKADPVVRFFFPQLDASEQMNAAVAKNMAPMLLCPRCQNVRELSQSDLDDYRRGKNDKALQCQHCQTPGVLAYSPINYIDKANGKSHYRCPYCNGRDSLAIVGLRNASATSVTLSQLFASRFNDDKKTLVFSDNVQDAAHRAGFFNSNAWRFAIRAAMQQALLQSLEPRRSHDLTVDSVRNTLSLKDFRNRFIEQCRRQSQTYERFIGTFMPPAFEFRSAYALTYALLLRQIRRAETQDSQGYHESVLTAQAFDDDVRRLGEPLRNLVDGLQKRLSYEVLLEYGKRSHLGRTLPKSCASCLYFAPETIETLAQIFKERIDRALTGISTNSSPNDVKAKDWQYLDDAQKLRLCRYVSVVYLDILRGEGAFYDKFYESFAKSYCKQDFVLSPGHIPWTPRVMRSHNVPRLLASNPQNTSSEMHTVGANATLERALIGLLHVIMVEAERELFEALREVNLLQEFTDRKGVFGLDQGKLFLTCDVVTLRCSCCGATRRVARENLSFWQGGACLRRGGCSGVWQVEEEQCASYYNRLFSSGDVRRIRVTEHTGLLKRSEREEVEREFKGEDGKSWRPNVLSCTPTLEMGVDIGDLSTVVLCGMPPGQAQFRQRIGRGGRTDGNSLTIVSAAGRARDYYFYAEPEQMLHEVPRPPRTFLNAPSVLERQFTAFCLDSWTAQLKPAAPEKGLEPLPPLKQILMGVGNVLDNDGEDGVLENNGRRSKLDAVERDNAFPSTFFRFFEENRQALFDRFVRLFSAYLKDSALEELRRFAFGEEGKLENVTLKYCLERALSHALNQYNSLSRKLLDLQKAIRENQQLDQAKNGVDPSIKKNIIDLQSERRALLSLRRSIAKQNVYFYLCDHGALPNYAFPEPGVTLQALFYRKDNSADRDKKSRKRRRAPLPTYEYQRGAGIALRELAPMNHFYVAGRKLTIDQIDMKNTSVETWRLCPQCSHAQLERHDDPVAQACPKCGATGWVDLKQRVQMLKASIVYSNTNIDEEGSISDLAEEREPVFYQTQFLVEVDKPQDVEKAYEMANPSFKFAYDYVRRATLREINFGQRNYSDEQSLVAGVSAVRKGFYICRECGKIQKQGKPGEHAKYCSNRHRNPDPTLFEQSRSDDAFINCLYLYREFHSEALRVLIPSTTEATEQATTESFTAAFLLGMTEYFGNVDHLRTAISEVPIPGTNRRKRYLVVYDCVPGGTGYLKELVDKTNPLLDILQKALDKLENCACKDDEERDGCFHCLYSYRQGDAIGRVSRRVALQTLRAILSGRDNLKALEDGSLDKVDTDQIYDSELEYNFVERLAQYNKDGVRILAEKAVVNSRQGSKEGYLLKIADQKRDYPVYWELVPQVDLGTPEDKVAVKCRPDFILYPAQNTPSDADPVAVFVDGFTYHKDRIADDTLKREAIRRSGEFRVWSLSWHDVHAQGTMVNPQTYATSMLDFGNAPALQTFFKMFLKRSGAVEIKFNELTPIETLVYYLNDVDATEVMKKYADSYANAFFMANAHQINKGKDRRLFNRNYAEYESVYDYTKFYDETFDFGGGIVSCFNVPHSEERLLVGACCSYARYETRHEKRQAPAVWAVLDDKRLDAQDNDELHAPEQETDLLKKFQRDWNGFLHFANLMQFTSHFIAVTGSGLSSEELYSPLAAKPVARDNDTPVESSQWDRVEVEDLVAEAREFANNPLVRKLPPPSEIGYEFVDAKGNYLAQVEMVWEDQRIAYLLASQLKYREAIEALQWRVVTSVEEFLALMER
ncbi:MAG: DEAD/DEAH box helicase [Planctomycetia bacterium]|nr:DEAD/DEAH box helicase [Planctomycetia bacterium]